MTDASRRSSAGVTTGLGGLLDRYVLRRFVGAYGLCLAGFVMLFLVMDFFGKLDDIVSAQKGVEKAGLALWPFVIQYYLTKLPLILTYIAPYLTLFAAIATLITFGRHNEITPMVAAGRSHHRVLAPVYVFAVLVVFGLVAVEEHIVPAAAKRHGPLAALIEGGDKGDARRPPHLRDRKTGNILDATLWVSSTRTLMDVHSPAYRDPRAKHPEGRFDAASLVYRMHPVTREVGWFPVDGTVTPVVGDGGGVLPDPVRLAPDAPIAFTIDPADIDIEMASREQGLTRREVADLVARYPMRFSYAMQLHTRTTRPISSLVLLLLGLPFVTRPGNKSIATGLVVALATCAAYAAVDFFFRQLGNRGDVQPLIAAWFAPAFFGAIALARIDRVSG